MKPPDAAFLGLGSNVGDREGHLVAALARLGDQGVVIAARSSLYLTEPVGGPPQGWFVNQVVRAETDVGPEALLHACLEIEAALGRERVLAQGPRTIDLDLLLYGDEVRETPSLTLPHPRLHERRFVLVPLCEIAPEVRHPVLGATAAEMLRQCRDTSAVRRHQPQETRP